MNELLELWQFQSVNVVAAKSLNSLIFGYVCLCLIIRRPVFLLAFLLPEMLFVLSWFDSLSEWSIYCFEVVIYSYVFDCCETRKQKFGCVTILLLSIALAVDAFLYGLNGYYGTSETLLYRNIESLALFAHLFFISSFIRYGRVRDSLRNFFDSIVRVTANSDYMLLFWYTTSKAINK